MRRWRGRRPRKAPRDPFQWGLELLQAYVARYGHACVPQHHRTRSLCLGQWVRRQRSKYRDDLLSAEQVRQLENLPGWSWDPLEEAFVRGLGHLKRYARRHGHARVPQAYVVDGFALGRWVSHRRRERRLGRLDAARAKRLEAVAGWTWDPRAEEEGKRYQEGLKRLCRYARRYGHANVPGPYVEGGFRLGLWVIVRRRQRREGRLARNQVRELGRLPGWRW